jgi:3'-phosphoadenosine 5'-phosphosulfate (PAPS) 3'-phosphatase
MGNICSNTEDGTASNANLSRHRDINIAEFLSVCIYLSEECGKVIRDVEKMGDLQTKHKGDESPVTVADITVQKTIEVCLAHLYPTLRVQGEESAASTATVESYVDPKNITHALKSFITSDFLNNHHS